MIFLFNIAPGQVGLSKKVLGGAGAIICEQTVCLCEDPVTARKAASGALASYMGLPNYYKNWFRLGFNEGDLEDGGSDRLTDTMVI